MFSPFQIANASERTQVKIYLPFTTLSPFMGGGFNPPPSAAVPCVHVAIKKGDFKEEEA